MHLLIVLHYLCQICFFISKIVFFPYMKVCFNVSIAFKFNSPMDVWILVVDTTDY